MGQKTLQEAFEETAELARTADKESPLGKLSNDDRLRLCGLYKQAVSGDAPKRAGWTLDPRAAAKNRAWAARQGMSSDDAMADYIRLVVELAQEDRVANICRKLLRDVTVSS
jgi:diazepam-binding inhibitor (GABA receptor modulating acyl-CoA-binding protein)